MTLYSDRIRDSALTLGQLAWGSEESGLPLKWGYNPLPPSPAVLEAIRNAGPEAVTRYSAASLRRDLTGELAAYAGVPPEAVTLANGCDKAFRLLAETFIEPGDELLMLSPSYPVLAEAVELMGGRVDTLPLDGGLAAPVEDLVERAGARQPKLVFIVNPNNPTSNLVMDRDGLEALLATDRLVVVDEAYLEIGGWSSAPLLERFPNLVILRSFSKTFALPGLRVAVILAAPELTRVLQGIEYSIEIFALATLSLIGARAALADLDYYRRSWAELAALRSRMAGELAGLGAEVADSRATFLFAATPGLPAAALARGMAERGILIKNMALYRDVDPHCSVIGLPSPADYERVMRALAEVLGNGSG